MEFYKKIVAQHLDQKRYEHSLGVAETAKELAIKNNVDPNKAYLAGILHDYAKNMPEAQLLHLGRTYNLIVDPVEIQDPKLLHGPVGSFLVAQDLHITDPEILKAVKYHTTACPEMDTLTQILYIADFIEPNRNFSGVDELRKVSKENLELGVYQGLNHTIKYVLSNNALIHSLSVQARNWLLITKRIK